MTIGFAGGEIPPISLNLVLLKNVTVRGMELRTWNARLTEETARVHAGLAELIAKGMRPVVSEVHDLDDIADAYQRVSDRIPTGKVLVRMTPNHHGGEPA